MFAALVRVMLRRGPAELTLREIAAEAGVTAGALVQRFGSKRKLLLAHAKHAAATGDIGFGAPLGTRATSHCEISPTCTMTWRIRCCAVTCCGSRGRRELDTSNWCPTPYLWASCGPIPMLRRWRA